MGGEERTQPRTLLAQPKTIRLMFVGRPVSGEPDATSDELQRGLELIGHGAESAAQALRLRDSDSNGETIDAPTSRWKEFS